MQLTDLAVFWSYLLDQLLDDSIRDALILAWYDDVERRALTTNASILPIPLFVADLLITSRIVGLIVLTRI